MVGEAIRQMRNRRGLTRRALAEKSGVSERFLAQLESGSGNGSILVLREIARALKTPIDSILLDPSEYPADFLETAEQLRHLTAAEMSRVRQFLKREFHAPAAVRNGRIALIGLRGAGKSTVGKILAEELGYPFIELDRIVEQQSGLALNMIFDLYGQAGFRRFELQALEQVLDEHSQFVLATSGSIVSEPPTFNRLLRECFTVWLRAAPEEHMQRVVAQGDMRPISQSTEAMTDLRRILTEREPLYARADVTIDTCRVSPEDAVGTLTADLALR
jgi:XRE family aerobic/anaerobic benzoate catabolism transcriptional regulator